MYCDRKRWKFHNNVYSVQGRQDSLSYDSSFRHTNKMYISSVRNKSFLDLILL